MILFLAFLIFPRSSFAQLYNNEKINSYDSIIYVNQDGSLTVTENIDVTALGLEIKRGIYRDFPTKYKDSNGVKHNVEFNVLEVKKDGISEPYHIENISNGVRVYIGEANTYLRVPRNYLYTC